MLKLSIMTEHELTQIFGTLDSLIPLHEGKHGNIINQTIITVVFIIFLINIIYIYFFLVQTCLVDSERPGNQMVLQTMWAIS